MVGEPHALSPWLQLVVRPCTRIASGTVLALLVGMAALDGEAVRAP